MNMIAILAIYLMTQAPQNSDRLDRAMQLIREQKLDLAYKDLTELVKDEPTNVRALAFLAATELQTARLDDSEKHVKMLVSADPENPDFRELRAQLYMARRDWKQAETEWRWMVNKRPNSEQAHMQLAASLLQEDRFREALDEVSKSLEINPKRGDARSLRGNILATLGRMDDAALDWSVALLRDEDDTVALAGLAVYLRQKDPDQALKYALRAVDVTGGKTLGPMRVLAMVYRSRGDTEKATQTLQRALAAFPNNDLVSADLNALRSPLPPAASKPPETKTASNSAETKPVSPKTTDAKAPSSPASKPLDTRAANNPESKPPSSKAPETTVVANPPAKPPETKLALNPPPVTAPPKAPSTSLSPSTSANSVPPATKPAAPAAAVTASTPPANTQPTLRIPALALGGLTLGASASDFLHFVQPPGLLISVAAPAPSKVAEAPPKTAPVQSKHSEAVAGPDPRWGKVPLSTISPAFVYATVPRPK